ncbi:hypothetical protein V1514DRAFT_330248 [Lipomyces japonicus]|uniref:uncharacterized protein n=1 Tax=Lipomyces japonicus TaxID=56871 RepID=UPI0034CE1463
MSLPVLKYPYLLSKYLDPIFGVAVGVSAFYLYEQRHGREEGHTLVELFQRRYQRELSNFRNKNAESAAVIPQSGAQQKRLAEAAAFENTSK